MGSIPIHLSFWIETAPVAASCLRMGFSAVWALLCTSESQRLGLSAGMSCHISAWKGSPGGSLDVRATFRPSTLSSPSMTISVSAAARSIWPRPWMLLSSNLPLSTV
jgi:hypothetical protein